VPYPRGTAASQRYRFEQYLKILEDGEFEWKIAPFINTDTWEILYHKGHYFKKAWGYFIGFLNRILLLLNIRKYHWIFIHREAIILGPALFEWILVKLFRKQIIYDFDDAIWITRDSSNNRLLNLFRATNKTSQICRLSQRVCVGNSFLADYARKFNSQVHVIPTTIDTQHKHCILHHHQSDKTVIGWTGSHSTLPFLFNIIPVLKRLEENYNFEFQVIADQNPHLPLKSYSYKKWDKESEIDDLMDIDIGLMPLPDNEWSLGKCGLKALQYMALGIPAVVSAIGANNDIVSNQLDGLHCKNNEEWYFNIEKLIVDPQLRFEMGRKGRQKVIRDYSVVANTPAFLSLFV
jgi:glycosyltransferase involved in cell wall biosynthesis